MSSSAIIVIRPGDWSGVVKDVFVASDYIYAVNGLGVVVEPVGQLHEALNSAFRAYS